MRILYVANHSAGGNDDEGAINNALIKLGHEVTRVEERLFKDDPKFEGHDVLLCHHLWNPSCLANVTIPKVFWCFDLIDYPNDPTLLMRNHRRKVGIGKLTKICDLGFMTDGDWVANDKTGKLLTLRQGADQRIVGIEPLDSNMSIDIIFTGSEKGGRGRSTFVRFMQQRFGNKFHQLKSIYRKPLAKIITASKVVVAPDHPMTDRYWSNRVYNTLGFGGLLLHPAVKGLQDQFTNYEHIIYYTDREHLETCVKTCLSKSMAAQAAFKRVRNAAVDIVTANHTYVNRCEVLTHVIQERLL